MKSQAGGPVFPPEADGQPLKDRQRVLLSRAQDSHIPTHSHNLKNSLPPSHSHKRR